MHRTPHHVHVLIPCSSAADARLASASAERPPLLSAVYCVAYLISNAVTPRSYGDDNRVGGGGGANVKYVLLICMFA